MKKAFKDLWRRIAHFWYPAIIMLWAADSYVTGIRDEKWLSLVLGFGLSLCSLIEFYEESEKLRKKESKEEKE